MIRQLPFDYIAEMLSRWRAENPEVLWQLKALSQWMVILVVGFIVVVILVCWLFEGLFEGLEDAKAERQRRKAQGKRWWQP